MHADRSTASLPLARLGWAATATALGTALAAHLIGGNGGGWLALGFAAMPDVALMFGMRPGLAKGQLDSRAVPLYNALHHPAGPILLALLSFAALGPAWLAGALAWGIHIAVDRAVGYGPRTPEGFQRG